MTAARVLIVDDEEGIRALIREILEDEGYEVAVAESATAAHEALKAAAPNLVLLDIWMPDKDGVSLLREWSESGLVHCPIVMMSGHATVETAVSATRLGAYDFLEKPLSTAKLLVTVRRTLENANLRKENQRLRGGGPDSHQPLGKSAIMQELRGQFQKVAHHSTPLLLIGEAGTDKERHAHHLHAISPRSVNPFLVAPPSALSGPQATATLLGTPTQPGLLGQAGNGTLFLKDIAESDADLQALLQEILERGLYQPVGGDPENLRTRVITATRYDLQRRVKENQFRRELYYQLSVVPIHLPPLREHNEDVPDLLEYYANHYSEQEGLPYRPFSLSAQNRLRAYPWPGNLRELRNLVQRLLILGQDPKIGDKELDQALGEAWTRTESPLFALPLRAARERFERTYFQYQLEQEDYNINRIARNTGMERTYLYRKLKHLGLEAKN